MTENKKIVFTRDNASSKPTLGCLFVEEDNDLEDEKIRVFTISRHELIQIVKYWAEVTLGLDYFMFIYSQTGSEQLRRVYFAHRRIGRIAEILGEDEVSKAIDEVYTKFGKNQDKRTWDIFLNGTQEQREEIKEEIQSEMAEWRPKED